jgi:hypothetical protein
MRHDTSILVGKLTERWSEKEVYVGLDLRYVCGEGVK